MRGSPPPARPPAPRRPPLANLLRYGGTHGKRADQRGDPRRERRPARDREPARLARAGRARAERRRRVRAARRHRAPRPPDRRGHRPRLHLEPADGHGRLRLDRPRRPARRRRGRLAVQPPRAGRPAPPSRADPDGRQLERRVAGARRDAQHQRLAHEDGPRVQHDLGRGLDRRLRRRRHRALDRRGHDRARHVARPRPGRRRARPGGGGARAAARRRARLGHGHPRRLRRGLHGHVQRDHRRRVPQPDGHLQGAAQPVGAGRGDAPGRRRRGARRLPLAARPRA